MSEQLAKLLAPFPPAQIQQLPKGNIKLDYVSHGNVTRRLLEVDPTWNWEPLAFDDHGLPQFDEHGGLWIKLTVLGITRLGYGEPQGSDRYDQTKGAIGNALRNAAMRFGVALDLWAKESAPRDNAAEIAHDYEQKPRNLKPRQQFGTPDMTKKQADLILSLVDGKMHLITEWKAERGIDRTLTIEEASELIQHLKDIKPLTDYMKD